VIVTDLLKTYEAGDHLNVEKIYNDNLLTCQSAPAESRILAASYFSRSEYSKCESILSDIYNSFSEDVEFLSLYGACCRRLQKFHLASQAFEKALSLSPDNPQLLNNYSNLLIDVGDLDKAKGLLSSLVSSNPLYTDAAQNLKRVEYFLSKPDNELKSSGGERHMPSSFSSSSVHATVDNPLDLAFSTEESKISTEQTRKKLSKQDQQLVNSLPSVNPDSLIADHLNLVERQISDSNYDEALVLLDSCYRSSPLIGRVYKLASDCYIGLNRFAEAETCLLHALCLDGPSPDIYVNLSSLALVVNNYSLSDHYLSKAASSGATKQIVDSIQSNIVRKQRISGNFSFSAGWSESLTLNRQ
jgi:Flp pilus assembly protein TadD